MRPEVLESRVSPRLAAGLASAALHASLLVAAMFAGGLRAGPDADESPALALVFVTSPQAGRPPGELPQRLEFAAAVAHFLETLEVDLPSRQPAFDRAAVVTPPVAQDAPEPVRDEATLSSAPVAGELMVGEFETSKFEIGEFEAGRFMADEFAVPVEPEDSGDTASSGDALVVDATPASFVMSSARAAAVVERIERIAAKELDEHSRAKASWKRHGHRYEAKLVLEKGPADADSDRVFADVRMEHQGRKFATRIVLARVSYAQFAKIVDSWNPDVQLHDDEVIGRTHINSRFNVRADEQARPTLHGRVSTSAGAFTLRSSVEGARESDVFRQGVEVLAGRISLAAQADRAALARPRASDARVHELAVDTRIRFLGEEGYWWQGKGAAHGGRQHGERSAAPVHFVAAPGVTLHVQGVVAGPVLVYSPEGIVVEGDLVYARDPRRAQDSDDYLGLVSDRDIELAAPRVTGPGDVDIHAALFAGRRFVVREFEHRVPATLRILGSLAAGSITATEPRYAMRVEYDARFDRRRPPGFPAMNRFVAEDWNRRWTVDERPAPAGSAVVVDQ